MLEYQFTLNQVPVEDWVNERLNKLIPEKHHKLYNDCIEGLEKIFRPYNEEKCSKCAEQEQSKNWVNYQKEYSRLDCGCCVKCAGNTGYTSGNMEREFLRGIKFDIADNQKSEDSWGYFDPIKHSCRIPRHLRSSTCLNYFCKAYSYGNEEMTEDVRNLVNVVQVIRREYQDDLIKHEKKVQKTLRKLEIIPWRKGNGTKKLP